MHFKTFTGENLDGKLTIERFLDFQEQLQREILRLEFNRKPFIDEAGTRIWERDFADLLLTYADYTPKKRSAVLKRVKKKYPNKADQEDPVLGITSDDYIQIFSLLLHIDDVDKVNKNGITWHLVKQKCITASQNPLLLGENSILHSRWKLHYKSYFSTILAKNFKNNNGKDARAVMHFPISQFHLWVQETRKEKVSKRIWPSSFHYNHLILCSVVKIATLHGKLLFQP